MITTQALHWAMFAWFADITPTVPWSATTQWMWGLLGFLGMVYLVLAVFNQMKKLVARRPPVEDDIASLRKGMKAMDDKYEERFADLQADRQRAWKELTDSINEVSQDVAFLRGRVDPQYRRHHSRQ